MEEEKSPRVVFSTMQKKPRRQLFEPLKTDLFVINTEVVLINHLSMATTTTATNFFLILLLIILSVFSTITTAQRNSNISIGSTLSPTTNSISWLSNSGRFAFGFYPLDGGFVVGIWFDGIPQRTVVWTANQDSPKVTNNVTLLLTSTQGLILQSAQGQNQSISDETSEPVSYASMLDTGNMVLYNSNSKIIWQSFDSPTNTILQGQPLKTGKALVSRVSETDYSKGKFELSMQIDGQLIQYPTEKPMLDGYSYWASDTYLSGTNVTLNLNDDGRLYLLNEIDGVNVKTLSGSDTSKRRNTPTNETIFYRLTIDVDGILRLYSHTLNRNGNWLIKWNSTDDKCAPKGLCGLNGYCTLMDREAKCRCLPGFSFIDPNQETLGCGRDTDVDACRSKDEQTKYTMHILEDTEWEDLPYSVLTLTTEENCRDACLEDCICEAVMFLNQECKKQKFPLRYGRRVIGSTTTATSFIKVADAKNTNAIKVIEKSKNDLKLAVLIASVSFVTCAFIVLGISGFLIYRHRTSARYKILEQGNNELNEAFSLRSFTYGELEKATDNFKEVLGRGSFGTVFKGALSDGKCLIAVKRLDKVVDEGEREFQAEMRTIGRTHHRSLVQLLGYCHEGTNRLLVYEYMSNGSLADFLFKSEESPSWNERVQIGLNISRGILYLHEECATQIIHCDIKPQNILMDEFRFAKIADFGLAKLLKQDQTKTYTGIRGTRGYVAPEWHKNLPVTVKADVYSFGIVLLEIICLRRSLNAELHEEEIVLVDWVFHCFDTGKLGKLVREEEVDMRRFERMIKVALWCIQDEPSMRPTMKKVVLMLEGTIDIPNPPSPTSFLSSI